MDKADIEKMTVGERFELLSQLGKYLCMTTAPIADADHQ